MLSFLESQCHNQSVKNGDIIPITATSIIKPGGILMGYDFDTPIQRRGTNCMKWDDMIPLFGHENLLPFWVADMDFRSAPEIAEAMRELSDFGVFGYPAMSGDLFKSVADWQGTRHGWDVAPSCVGLVPGVVAGVALAIQAFTKPGDGIVLQTPAYPPFFGIIQDNGRVITESPLIEAETRYEMDFENLEEAFSRPDVKAMILCSPHNPVARVWSREELSRLGALCDAYGITVLSDEIHQDLVYSDAKHIPTAVASPVLKPRLLTLVAPSKTFNVAGLSSSAWIAEDEKVSDAMKKSLDTLHMGRLNLFAAKAMEIAYRKGAPWLDALMPYLEGNRAFVEAFLRERLPGASMKHPEGTFIFWLDFRGYGLSSDGLQRILVDRARVALNPGTAFGRQGEGFARLNIGCPRAQLEEGLGRIAEAFA